MIFTFIDFHITSNHRIYRDVWLSGNHEDNNPPDYYIKWAQSKRLDIPWIDAAKDKYLHLLPKPSHGWDLDPDKPHYPQELDIAYLAWKSVTNNDVIPDNPKKALRHWLNNSDYELSNAQIDRICKICNWDKKGGRPKEE